MHLSERIFKEASGPDYSFSFNRREQPYFYDKYHHHPEYELSFIEKGRGLRFVGDNIAPFQEGDMILLGPNLSHMWKCDRHYYEDENSELCCSYVIHFPEGLVEKLLDIPEMSPIHQLLTKSKRGVKIEGRVRRKVVNMLHSLSGMSNNERFFTFLHMLHTISTDDNLVVLSRTYMSEKHENKQSERLNAIYNHLLANVGEKVKLAEVAEIANMSPTALCRFIKNKTGKSFTHLLNEIRINHACRLLLQSSDKIAQVAMASGFNNLSHFNKRFKAITSKSPREFAAR